ncbi:MAG: lamin tail domain-containing protein, partial [Bacteroidia bacterium]
MKKKLSFLFLSFSLFIINNLIGQTSTKFNDGYLTVFKATSASALTNTGTAIVAEEYNTTTAAQAAPNYSVAIPSASGNKLVVSGTATSSGGMTRSQNGRYLLLPGYNGLVGDANSTFTTNATIRTINASGTVGAGISGGGATLWLSGSNNLRGATSDDGTNYWFSGNGVGIQTSTNGTTVNTVSTTTTNNRDAFIYNGQLYLTTGAGAQGIYSVGSGTPVTTGNTGTRLFAPTNTDVYAFSLSPDGNTIYYVAATAGGIYRSTFNGTTWTAGTQIFSGTGYTGLAVDWRSYSFSVSAANGARIYASNPSTIIAANDNGTTTVTTTILRTEPVPTNNAFRQLTFSPSKQTVSLGANSPVASTINTSTNDVVLFQFNLNADEGNSTLKKVIINQTGTATIGAGNDISNFRLVEDVNNNGIAEAGELSSVLSTGNIVGSTIILDSINLATYINEGSAKNFLLVGNVSATATSGNTFIPSIVSNKTLNSINYTTNIINAGGSWINVGTAVPTGNALTITTPVIPPLFAAGNIVVVQTTGSTSKGGSAVNLNQYSTSGVPSTFVAISATGATPLQMASGSGGSEGFLTKSPDGTYLSLAGYSTATTGIADITVTTASAVPRVVFKVDATGAYTQVASSTTDYNGNDIRGAISDNTNFWASGASNAGIDGIDYYGPGPQVGLGLSAKAYGLQIFAGQIYFSTQKVVVGVTPNFGIYSLGTGFPTSGTPAVTPVINTGTATPEDFSFNPTGDVCYIAINMNTIAGGIQKWIKTGATWNLAYTLGTGASSIGAYGLVVDYSSANPVLYATTNESNTVGNRIIKIIDTGSGSSANTIVAATPNTFFHGISFAPTPSCIIPAQPLAFTTSSDTVYQGQTSVIFTVPNDAVATNYTWSYSGTGATIHGTGNSVTIDFSSTATSGTISVVATNSCGSSTVRSKPVAVITLPGAMRITEYMYNGGGAGSVGEFVEFTNVGGTPVDMTGWSFDDNTRTPGSQDLSAFGTVQPGESVILTEIAASTFRANWGLCPPVKVIGGCTNNLGREDEINLYNASSVLVDRLTYGDVTYSPGSIRTNAVSGWVNAAGLGNNIITDWTLSSVADAESSVTSSLGEIGSPGKSSRGIVFFDPCVITNTAPVIFMSTSTTTNFADGGVTTSPGSPYGISGVINDPTDPLSSLGIDFTVNDAETPASGLTVTAVSSNTTVVPNANIIVSGTGATRNVKISAAAVGYSNITVTVSDGSANTSYIISYAASVASTTPASTFWHTGMSDASDAIAIDDNYYMSGDDELDVLNVYSRSNSGLPLVSYDYASNLSLPDPTKPEVDVEAAASSTAHPNRVYWLGSMSNGKAPFNNKPNRDRLFATTYSGTGATTSFSFVGYYGNLRASLISWGDANGYNFTASAADGVDSKTVSGFAAEGMVLGPDNSTLYIGMRAPLVPTTTRTKAVIAPILNFETWFNDGSPAGSPVFGSPIELDLGGRGFRDLVKLSNGTYIIVAGDPGGVMTSAIYVWTGNAADVPVMVSTSASGVLNMEGAMQVNVAGSLSLTKLQVISDGGDEILYADGSEAKDFADLNLRKFRSDNLSSINLCLTKTGDTIASACNNFTWHGTTYTSSATPTYLLTTFTGCDSIVTLHLTIHSAPSASLTVSGATTFCSGNSVTFTAPAGNTYQWQLNGSPISGATSSSYNANASGNYTAVVTNTSGCSTTSSIESVTVNPLPTASITAGGPTTFCSGSSVTFSVPAGNTYQWQHNGFPVTGATSNTYNANASGNYFVVVTSPAGCVNSSPVQSVTVDPLPTVTVTPAGSTTFCDGDSVMLSSSSGTSYQWMYNGSNISGATSSTYNAMLDGNYSVTISNGTCSATSSDIYVTVNTLPTVPVVTQSGSLLTSTVATTYQWYMNGSPVSGATSQSYTVLANGTYYVTITNSSGCEASSAPVVITATGIAAIESTNSVIVYPNPYNDFTSVQITLTENENVSAEVYTLLGEHVQTLVSSELA